LNYFNYFTEIETRFQQRRGSLLMLSTLDWALIETWREAGIPLEAALRGIDAAFDKHDAQRMRARGRRQRNVNGLAWCSQSVLEATEQAREAAVGSGPVQREERASGFEPARIAHHLATTAAQLLRSAPALPPVAATTITETADRLRQLAAELGRAAPGHSGEKFEAGAGQTFVTDPDAQSLEHLDRTLTVLEEKVFAALLASAPEEELTILREQADRELAPYRSRMQAHQIKQVQQQFLHKRLIEKHSLPRLSLFYMPHE
jgi:hypothetical protein